MECVSLTGIKFSPRSVEAIGEFRRKHRLARLLTGALPAGTMATIFVGNDALKASFSAFSSDFKVLAEAMKSVPDIERKVLSDIAQYAALDTAGSESLFWRQVAKGIQNGCTYSF